MMGRYAVPPSDSTANKEHVMTQYLLSVHHDEHGPDLGDTPMETVFAQVDAFNQELMANGSWVFAGGLEPPTAAKVVTATGADAITTDGPYTESKEYMGGFWVVEAPDLDAALEIARRGSAACLGPVEVRPFQAE
jgi:hypothetical protein